MVLSWRVIVSIESWVSSSAELTKRNWAPKRRTDGSNVVTPSASRAKLLSITASKRFLVGEYLSPWSESTAKRVFDCLCVLALLPLLAPIFIAVALAVRLTSRGPVFFLQERAGCYGEFFTILKFRTMQHTSRFAHRPVTTTGNQKFTSIGPFLRRWKLDELPQLLNVLAGDMSLVGPRPKMAEHAIKSMPCRPGVTGAATIAFAREEAAFSRLPDYHLESFYHAVILPAKLQIDAEYMARATFFSDLKLIVRSVVRSWDSSVTDRLLREWAAPQDERPLRSSKGPGLDILTTGIPNMDRRVQAEETSAF